MNQQLQLLTDLVNEMIQEDQKMRNGEIEWSEDIDRKHTEAIKPILAQMPNKWPTISEHGQELCSNIWMLVQHADHDLAFQKECLENLQKLLDTKPEEVVKPNAAYLTDRVMVKTTNQQKYGTQWQDFDTFLVLRPLVDPENISKLREEMGLESLVQYQKVMQESAELPTFLTIEEANKAGFTQATVVAQEILRQLENPT